MQVSRKIRVSREVCLPEGRYRVVLKKNAVRGRLAICFRRETVLRTIRRKLEWNEPLSLEERLTLIHHPKIAMGITPVYERLLREGTELNEDTRMDVLLLIVMSVPQACRRQDEELPPAVAAARTKQALGERLDFRESLLLRRESLFVCPAEAASQLHRRTPSVDTDLSSP